MKLAIFGASGRTGRPLVEQALAAGYSVTALVRDPAKLPISNERLTIIQGDALDPQAVDRTVAGADAVLSTLGQTKGSPKNMQTVATQNIAAAMQQHGVRRLVSLTGAGVRVSQDKPKLVDHAIRFAMQTLMSDLLRDAEAHVDVLRSSDLDWVLVRGPVLTDGPHTGKYRVGWVGVNTSPRIARADVADFMLKQTTDSSYVRQAPMVSD